VGEAALEVAVFVEDVLAADVVVVVGTMPGLGMIVIESHFTGP
jgi:ABC-type enterochelin transport system permease subunit